MTRSLRTRWTLALVIVCLVEAALVAAAVRVTTVRAFDRFVIEEALEGFAESVEATALETGSVESVRPLARAPQDRPPQGRPPRDRGREDAGPRDGRPGTGDTLPKPREFARGVAFGLADASGLVVLPFDAHARGATLSASDLARGRPVISEGVRIGTAFVPRGASDGLPSFPAQSPEARFIRSSTAALLWALTGSLALAIGLAFWLTGRTVRPLRTLRDAAGRIASGDLKQSVAVETEDEVGQLAEAFNAMSTKLAESTALRQRMTADISHDLRTPLTAVLGILEAVSSGALPATPERLTTAHAEAKRLSRMVDDLHTLTLADADELPIHIRPVQASGALDHVARLFEAEASGAGVALSVSAPEALSVHADPDRLSQILSNLVGNAIRHTPAGGRITLGASASGESVALTVKDTGEGIPPEALPLIFERSVRADAARSGTGSGLGLSIVRSLAEAMAGSAEILSTPEAGTTVTVRLPRA